MSNIIIFRPRLGVRAAAPNNTIRPDNEWSDRHRPFKGTKSTDDELRSMWNSGVPNCEIARALGCTGMWLNKRRRQLGLPDRPRGLEYHVLLINEIIAEHPGMTIGALHGALNERGIRCTVPGLAVFIARLGFPLALRPLPTGGNKGVQS